MTILVSVMSVMPGKIVKLIHKRYCSVLNGPPKLSLRPIMTFFSFFMCVSKEFEITSKLNFPCLSQNKTKKLFLSFKDLSF